MSEEDTSGTIRFRRAVAPPSVAALFRGFPPEFMALGSMLSIQLGAALAVPVVSAIGSATTTALRLLWAAILLAIIGYLILAQHLSLRQILDIACVVLASAIAAAESRAA